MSLYEWQRELQDSILSGSDLIAQPLAQGSISREREIHVYAEAYWLRLAEALHSNYPALHQLLGDEDFASLARAYLSEYPSQHPSIRWFGAQLGDFLARVAPYADLPIMAELAHFEWALRHTVDAADAKRLSLAELQNIAPQDWATLALCAHPSLTLFELQWNTPQLWQALTAGESPPAPLPQSMAWLVWRQADLISAWRSSEAAEMAALKAVTAGCDFAQVCEVLMQQQVDNVPLLAAQLLRSWIEQGIV